MTSGDLLGEAVEELYSADPEEFTARRGELAAAARSAGQAAAARQIAALRKPTRSAWVINQLARTDPGAVARLAELGEELRAAERSRDGGNLRELSQARRQLIAALVRQALSASGQQAAPAALREDVTATLAAALADPEVAGQIQHGVLLRPARRAGFGTEQGPVLALVPPPAARKPSSGDATTSRAGPSAGRAAAVPGRTRAGRDRRPEAEPEQEMPDAGQERQADAERVGAEADAERVGAEADAERVRAEAEQDRQAEAERARAEAEAEAERERRQARADAEQALAEADSAVQAARSAEQDLQDMVRRLERQLTDLRRRLHEARTETRQAEIAQRKARQVLGRLPE